VKLSKMTLEIGKMYWPHILLIEPLQKKNFVDYCKVESFLGVFTPLKLEEIESVIGIS
jgi:hypothetical protein